jgi:aspartyl-tRNA(Asn)/glutamyl-tRNA(Gln) amidotransferase subunit A
MSLPLSIQALHQAWCEGTLSMEALHGECDARITRDAALNIWLARTPRDTLLDQARALDALPAPDRRDAIALRPLLGVPVGIKDNICTRALPTTAASRMLAGYTPPFDATSVTRLIAAGAIVLGKTNMDEFGMGSSGAFSAFGPTLHPLDPARAPGGSSSGSAAALAAGHCMVTLGSDTGGSVRQPAAHCGVWGLKPTYGRVSRYGLIAHASSLDQIGPMARGCDDLALAWRVIAGHDPLDATSSSRPVMPTSRDEPAPMRLGLPSYWTRPEVCPEAMWGPLRQRLDPLIEQGLITLHELDLPSLEHASSTYAILSAAEASSNLARYDGVRFGHRASGVMGLDAMMRTSRTEGFGAEVRRRLLLGTHVLSAEAFDSHLMQAQRVRALIASQLEQALERCDLLFAPATSSTAPWLNKPPGAMLERFLDDTLTVTANLAGLPAICFPLTTREGFPVGAQLIGARFDDQQLLWAADRLMRALHGGDDA